MSLYYRPTIAEISLDALGHNIAAFRRHMPTGTLLMASVKANAYGHGAAGIAREALACGVDYLGVAFLDEALQLRRKGIRGPILVLGYVPPEGLEIAREQEITIALFREDILAAIAMLPASAQRLKVHIKLDTGMGRLGLLPEQDWRGFIRRVLATSGVEVEGVFTHFARADERDKSYTRLQHDRFVEAAEYARAQGVPIIHSGNSATGIDTPDWAGGMLRLGISMYGLYPSGEVEGSSLALQPVLRLKTQTVMVKSAPPDWGISYGTRYVTSGREWIGTLPIGYADGYSRMLTGKAEALLRGQRVPILGTICMDQCMIAIPGDVAEPGEEVVLIGRQGDETISAEEIADHLGTINYEVTCMLADRVPRVYVKDGQHVADNRLLG
ncbi:alanine racemase [Paenibacillus sp. 598K]|uniref:alanine racemase n=1 Tax=Paenibacillus sp. 598K TaxID=1117987 RepID=UPI000FFADD52|nr:alanine racemase [Paenibacillus sp. 598K]GBF78243.1 alanine racemase [Paenibacillus sp. 598K]